MYVGSELLEIYLPGVKSLKEKRKYIHSIKARLKNKVNLSVSEVGFHDLLQRSQLGLSVVAGERKIVRKNFDKIRQILKNYPQLVFSNQGETIERK